jgi:pimeloyl-ACP methyl ester carboxylesterase
MRKTLGELTHVLKLASSDLPQVPLDYTDPDGQQAAIALVRKPALIPKHSHLYRGPVLFNPGGPGGSGVALILALGNTFSTIIGPQFDIVGFDPRGTSHERVF